MSRTAIITVAIGEKFLNGLGSVTHPTIQAYADKIGAEFIVIDKNPYEELGITPHFAKLGLKDYYKTYDRILFIDTDCIIRPDCPNLFEIVPPTKFGAFAEGQFIPRRMMDLEMAAKTYSTKIRLNPKEWKGQYFNSGVLVTSKRHKMLFTPPDFNKIITRIKLQEKFSLIQQKTQDKEDLTEEEREFLDDFNSNSELQEMIRNENWDYGEQGWLNLQVINSSTPFHYLDYKFNRMTILDEKTGEERHDSYIIHYAGAPEEITLPNRETLTLPEFIQRDIEIWEKHAPDYKFKRHVLITIGGGLGDQIDAEPVVRHIKEAVYPGEDIRLITDWTRIFQHLGLPCFKRADVQLEPEATYYQMETLPIPESEFGAKVSHALMHSTDYSALSCLRTTLPHNKKSIKLQANVLEEAARLLDIIGMRAGALRDLILIHPGRGWASKTFPSEWWQEIIDNLVETNLRIALIGKEVGDDQGLVPVECPEEVIDLRNKCDLGMLFTIISQSRVLITNDSAPLHIAGAFDNYLIVIPTCKHPDHILPWRNGEQHYKTAAMYKELVCEKIDNSPTQVHGQNIGWIPGGDILPYLPNSKDVVDKAIEFYQLSETEDLE